MIKKYLHCFHGIVIGVFFSMTIQLVFCILGGYNLPVDIYVKNYIAGAVIGIISILSSFIYNIKKISLLKQTLIHMVVILTTCIPIAIWADWFSLDNITSLLSFLLIWILIYFCIWVSSYYYSKKQLQQINKKLNEK